MQDFQIVGEAVLLANTVDGVLHCHVGRLGERLAMSRVVATIHRLSIEQRAFGVLVHVTGQAARCDLVELRDAVLVSAMPPAEFSPWAWVVPGELLDDWGSFAHRLSQQGMVTGLFTESESELAEGYLRRHGPLWLAERRWLVAASRPVEAPGQSLRKPYDVPRPM